MTSATVRTLGGEDWRSFRELRLAALQDAPEAFVDSYADESAYDEAFWRVRLGRATRIIAVIDDKPVGIVSIGSTEDPTSGDLYGLWVAPEHRGTGVAMALVQSAARQAQSDGRRKITLWVGTDNGRAVAFFSSVGFRPTDDRRPMAGEQDVTEICLELPVGADSGSAATAAF
ncbi:MAG: GNAT family N-acetyltransferase [Angustibacter sp.]